ncbi:MAG: glycerol-3-phosphate 1-O-acyltransferase PlsY [Thermodesulfovibrionia bacterium]
MIKYLLIPAAYVIGSIPFGVLVSRTRGIDLQKAGSRSIGTTNVLRTAGKGAAVITLLGDSLKGVVAVLLCRVVIGGEIWEGIIGITVILGHMHSTFLSFRGGKGVATGFGVLSVYSPAHALILIVIWILTAFFTKYSSLAAMTAFISLPVVFLLSDVSRIKTSFAILLAFLIILKHRDNISRLLNGTETKIRF